MKFETVELSDVTSLITKGTTPTSVGCNFTDRGINYIKSESITSARKLDSSKFSYISATTHEKLKRSQIHENDILFSMAGMFLGKTGIANKLDVPANTNQAVAIIRIKPDLADYRYVYYYLNQYEIVKYINSLSGQSAQPNINLKQIGELQVNLPNIKVQSKIASILSVLDDKIELNNQINDNLADLLQSVYQQRFGDVSSATTQGHLADICSYSKDKVSVADLTTDSYFSTENMLPGKAGAIEATSLPTINQTTACHAGDTLISNIRPYFKKIVYCQNECGCSTDVLCFTPHQSSYATYLFSTLYADRFFDFMVAGAKGTKMPRGDKQQIMTYPIARPDEAELKAFNSVALPILAQRYANVEENKRLSSLRDALLPKLMSGEIDVSDVQL